MTDPDIVPLPPTGVLRPDGAHLFPIRVYYEDTDAAGIVYFANYLKFGERARTAAIHAVGLDHRRLAREDGCGFVVRRVEVDYRAPARLEDALLVETRVLELTGARLILAQNVRYWVPEGAAGAVLAASRVTLACITGDGRPVRLPASVTGAMARLMTAVE